MTLVLTATALASANRSGERRSAQAGGPASAISSLSLQAQDEPTARLCPLPKRFRPAFERASKRTDVPLSVLAAMAQVESNFQPNAISHAGARGLLQVLPSTAQELKINLGRPDADVLAGARYLKRMLDRFARARARRLQRRPNRGGEGRSGALGGDAYVREQSPGALAAARRLLVGRRATVANTGEPRMWPGGFAWQQRGKMSRIQAICR
jgi:soluble lytic murein transglycosylase-like protein